MSGLHKSLITGLVVSIMAYAGLKVAAHKIADTDHKASTSALTQNTRYGPSRDNRGDPLREKRQRARILSDEEVAEFLSNTIIPRISLEDIKLTDAIELLNETISEQTLADQPRPKIMVHPSLYLPRPIDTELHDALGGSGALEYEQPMIRELRIKAIPAAILLGYICDASKTRYRIDHGKVIIIPQTG